MKPFIKAFSGGITLDSMRRNDTATSENISFFQFWGHNVPINHSKLLGVRKRNEALVCSFLARRGRMSSERYCHTPGVVVVVVVVVVVGVDNFRLKFLFFNLSQVKVSVY